MNIDKDELTEEIYDMREECIKSLKEIKGEKMDIYEIEYIAEIKGYLTVKAKSKEEAKQKAIDGEYLKLDIGNTYSFNVTNCENIEKVEV